MDRSTWGAWIDPPVWGMVHLLPLPGSPGFGRGVDSVSAVLDRALADVEALAGAGYRGVMVENYGDLPFRKERVEAVTLAVMTRVATELRRSWPGLRIGINCLRNDARAALAAATGAGADAIRVNVHTGVAVTDQGLIEGRADQTLRLRRHWGADDVRILADVEVKHARPLGDVPLDERVADLCQRGQADVLLVTGPGTGRPADPERFEEVRRVAGETPVLVASGVTAETAFEWAGRADGAIVGSDLMSGGRAGAGVEADRAARLLESWTRGARARAE